MQLTPLDNPLESMTLLMKNAINHTNEGFLLELRIQVSDNAAIHS